MGLMLVGGRKMGKLKVGNASTMHGRGGLGCCRGSGFDMMNLDFGDSNGHLANKGQRTQTGDCL